MKTKLRAADMFCGAGGSTTGAIASGVVDVKLAINHWRVAIYSHAANHPDTRHICARIDDIDPRNDRTIPAIDLLMASPECTHHSIARGGRPIDDQKRATPWHVVIWAEAKRPKWVVVENVREFRSWGPLDARGRQIKSRKGETFRAWIRALESVGYEVDHQLLNAADFGEATKRIRLFVIARRRGRPRGRDIPWPEPTHAGRWRAAHEIIDWSKPCPSIFERRRPLAEKTLRRIEIGLRKFVGGAADPFIVKLRGTSHTDSVQGPLPTITSGGTHLGVAQPFLVKYHGGRDPRRDGTERSCSLAEPLPTLDTQPRYGLVSPFLLAVNHGGVDDRSRSPRSPLAALTTKNGHSLVLPFLTKYYGTSGAVSVDAPLDTVTTKDRFGLALVSLVETMRRLGVVDVGFRMLGVDELARAQGFPEGYVLHGNKAEQVKQIGNAVCPGVMKAICQAIAA